LEASDLEAVFVVVPPFEDEPEVDAEEESVDELPVLAEDAEPLRESEPLPEPAMASLPEPLPEPCRELLVEPLRMSLRESVR
jgi:hypothetical protein